MQYTIGEFAALNKMTARMLRHYDKIDLFKPAAILENGYRAYTSEQIVKAAQIQFYQSCRFSLAEIKELLNADEAGVRRLSQIKMETLQVEDAAERNAWKRLSALGGDACRAFQNDYDIAYAKRSPQILFSSEKAVPESRIESEIEKLYEAMNAIKAPPAGLLMLMVDLEENMPYRAAVPVQAPVSSKGGQCIHMASAWYLSTFHYGGYHNIGVGYDRLLQYAGEQNQKRIGPFIERYFVDVGSSALTSQYITEISVEISD